MENAQRTLREELELQYDIDHATTAINQVGGAAAPAAKGSANAAAGATATKKKKLLWKEGDLVSAVVADVAYAPPITKPAAVEVELNRWLSRPPDADDVGVLEEGAGMHVAPRGYAGRGIDAVTVRDRARQ